MVCHFYCTGQSIEQYDKFKVLTAEISNENQATEMQKLTHAYDFWSDIKVYTRIFITFAFLSP